MDPFNWQACVDALSAEDSMELAEDRAWKLDFCDHLIKHRLVGKSGNNLAFPVQNGDNSIIGAYCKNGANPQSGQRWFYRPSGIKAQPFIIGELATAKTVVIGESQWDVLTYLYLAGWPNTQNLVGIATRGAALAKKLKDLSIPEPAKIILLPQNDPAGQKWTSEAGAVLNRICDQVVTPEPHKDLNDWLRSGATADDVRIATKPFYPFEESKDPDVPEISLECFDDWKYDPLEPPEVIIEEVLDRGAKMSLDAGSKAKKTWALIDLGVSVATGYSFLEMETIQGPVLYVNFEVRPPHFRRRVCKVRERKAIAGDMPNFFVLTLRGYHLDHEVFIKLIARKAREIEKKVGKLSVIIIDPFYKLLNGADENSAGDVAKILSKLERIAVEVGAALVYSHHFSKGNQATKDAIDRGSGSGVFGRDPDAKIIFTAHEQKNCYTVDFVLRDFPQKDPFVVRFADCLFERADNLRPDDLKKTAGRKSKFTTDMLLEALGSEEITDATWKKRCAQQFDMGKDAFYKLKKQLLREKAVYQHPVSKKFSKTASQHKQEQEGSKKAA